MGLFSSLFGSAGELERTPIDLSDDAWYMSGAGEMSRDEALKYSAVFRAVNLISTSVGKLPLVVYKRVDGGKSKATDSPAYNLLRYKPNIEMTAKIFKQTITGHALLQGSGYAYIFRDGGGRPQEIIPLDPEQTHPVRENGKLFYVTSVSGDMLKLFPENVLHIRGLGYTGITSYSLLEYAQTSFSMGRNSQKFSTKFFENSARPGVILEHPATISESAVKRLRTQWAKLYSGIDNAHKTAVLEEGMKANFMTMNAKDSQLIETMKFSVVDVANWFSLPPHKLGDSSRTAYNSLEQENQSFLDEALDNWLVTWEEECRDKLLTEEEKRNDSHVVEFTRQALVRADLKARAEYYAKATAGAPWMTVNEVRNKENTNEIGNKFSEIILPVNLFSSNSTDQVATPSPEGKSKPNNDVAERAENALNHVKKRMLDRIRKDFDNHSKRNELDLFIQNFQTRHGEILKREIEPVAGVIEALGLGENIVDKTIKELLREVQG